MNAPLGEMGPVLRRQSIREAALTAQTDLEHGESFGLREHQIPAFTAGISFLLNESLDTVGGSRYGHYVLPTGFGKTVLMAKIATAAGIGDSRFEEQQRPTGIIFVPTRYLKDQTIGNFDTREQRGFAHHAPHINLVPTQEAGGMNRRSIDMQITTYQHAIFAARSGLIKPGQFDIAFHDESHHTLGSETRRAIAELCEGSINIGLTATPEYSNLRHIQELFPHQIAKVSLLEGIIEHKFLSAVQLFSMHSRDVILEDKNGYSLDFTESEIGHLAQSEQRNLHIVALAQHALRNTGGKGMIRCVPGDSQEHAKHMAYLLSQEDHPREDRKVTAVAIGSFRSQNENKELLDRFVHTDQIDVLTSVRMGGEGLDVPELRWGIWGVPSTSYVDLAQFIGRGLRPKNPNMFSFYHLVDHVSNMQYKKIVAPYKLFDLETAPPQGHIIGPGPKNAHSGGGNPGAGRPANLSDFEVEFEDLAYVEKTQTVLRRAEVDISQRLSLGMLATASGLKKPVIRELLAKNNYDAITTLDYEMHDHFYAVESLGFLASAVAKKGDKAIQLLPSMLGISAKSLKPVLDKMSIPTPMLYEPELSKTRDSVRSQLYVRAADLERLKQYVAVNNQPIQPNEMTSEELQKISGKSAAGARSYFDDRGFAYTIRHPAGTHNSIRLYNREEVLDWHEAYTNAQPLPENGEYVPAANVAQCSAATLYRAAREHNIPVSYFVKGNKVIDCIHTSRTKELQAHAAEHLKATAAYYAKEYYTQEEIAGAADVPLFAVQHALDQLGEEPLTLRGAKPDDPPKYGRDRTQQTISYIKRAKNHDLAIVESELALQAAIANIAYEEPATIAIKKQLPLLQAKEANQRETAHAHRERTRATPSEDAQAVAVVSAEKPKEVPSPAQPPKTVEIHDNTKPNTVQPTRSAAEPRPQSLVPSSRIQNLQQIDIPEAVPLVRTAQAVNVSILGVLALIAHHPRYTYSQVGLSKENKVVVDRHTVALLRAHLKDLPHVQHDWKLLEDVAQNSNIDPEELKAQLRKLTPNPRLMVLVPDQERPRYATFFVAPPLIPVLLHAARTKPLIK